MLPKWTVIGFSGHRKLADAKITAEGIRKALDRLAANHGPLASVSSAASGADTLFVEEVARRNWPYLLILPSAKTRFQQDFNSADWQRVLPFIEKATYVEEISREESPEGSSYMETGVLTVDKADVMIVVWDGKDAAGLGGTGDIAAYTRELGKPLMIVDPVTGEISDERFDRLPAKSSPTNWNESPRTMVEEHFRELDEAAKKHAPGSRNLVLRIILLQLAASAIGFCVLVFGIQNHKMIILAAELGLLGAAFVLSLRHRKERQEWTKNRIEAEICRSVLATWEMRQRADFTPKISIQGFVPLCRNLQLIRILDKTPPLPLESVRVLYLNGRLENQRRYFAEESEKARKKNSRFKRLALGCTALAFLLSLLGPALPQPNGSVLALDLLKYISLVLPLISAAFFSLMVTQDYSRRAIRYGEMAMMLENAAKRLNRLQTWNSFGRMVTETEEELLQEIVEWHSFRQFAGEPH